LIDIATQAEQALVAGTPITLEKEEKSSTEIRTLATVFNQLLQKPTEESADELTHMRRESEFSAIINEATNRLNGIINYSQLLADYCETANVGGEQKQILCKIIQNGEKCAEVLRKGLQ
jgi:hypothetical protein